MPRPPGKLALVTELSVGPITLDGTVKDALRMARGYWEAKDTHDDLHAEIQAKFNREYPTDNILFDNSAAAVVFQNGAVAMRVDMTQQGELHCKNAIAIHETNHYGTCDETSSRAIASMAGRRHFQSND